MKNFISGYKPCTTTIQILSLIYLVLSANSSLASLIAGDLIISEVMANPNSVTDSNGEWFEIYNSSFETIDLNGLTLSDNGSNQHQVTSTSPLYLSSNSYFIFGRNTDTNSNGGLVVDYQYSSFTLGNSEDEIILTYDGIVITSLLYDDSSLFGVAGNSAEWNGSKFQLTTSTEQYGDGDIGTPGKASSNLESNNNTLDLQIATVPEPSSFWLLVLGIISLVSLRDSSVRKQPVLNCAFAN